MATNTYYPITKYSLDLTGTPGGVPDFTMMTLRIFTSNGNSWQFQYSIQTAGAYEKIKILLDLLRNEKNVSYNPGTNDFAVQQELVGQKDA